MDVCENETEHMKESIERVNRLYSVLSKINEAIVRIREPKTLYEEVCRIAVDDGLFRMAWVGLVDADDQSVRPAACWGQIDGYLEDVRFSALQIPEGLCPTGMAVREGKYEVCEDLERDQRPLRWRLEAIKRGYLSHAAFPLRVGPDVIGALSLYAGEPGFFDAEQIRLLEALADDISFAIESLEKEEKRRHAEEALRLSERHFRSIIENNLDIIMIIDTDGNVRYVSPSVNRVLGYKRSEVRGRNIRELIHPEDVDRLIEANARVLRDVEVTEHAEVRFKDGSGSWRTLEFVGKGLLEDSSTVGVVINARDITERKLAEEAQKKDRDFISEVLDTTEALVVVLDGEGRIILFNRTCEKTTGCSFGAVRGRHFWDVFSMPEETGSARAFFEASGEGGVREEYESHCLTRDGKRRLIAWSNSVIFGGAGSVEYVIGTGIDMTERKEAEAALIESEERYRSIFESTGTAMCLVESDTIISFVNHEFERMTGFSARQVEGKKNFVDFVLPEDAGDFLDSLRGTLIMQGGAPVNFECRMINRGGEVLNVLANMGPLQGVDRVVVSMIDITREKQFERDLAEKAERLRNFLTIASHELRHPITIVKGYAKTLVEYAGRMSDESIRGILVDLDAASDRLTHYVDELMDVSRVEEGRFPVQKRAEDPEMLLRLALDDVRVTGCENDFRVVVSKGVGTIDVDHEKFTQLLVMLLENAVKFSQDCTAIEIEIERSGGEARLAVLDRGIGVPEEDREKIFDRFYQVEDVLHHSKPGIGLGLYIAREIVSAHGGRIWCEPRAGGGSVFRVSIP